MLRHYVFRVWGGGGWVQKLILLVTYHLSMHRLTMHSSAGVMMHVDDDNNDEVCSRVETPSPKSARPAVP